MEFCLDSLPEVVIEGRVAEANVKWLDLALDGLAQICGAPALWPMLLGLLTDGDKVGPAMVGMTLIANGDCDVCGFARSISEFVSHLNAMHANVGVDLDNRGVYLCASAVPQHIADSAQRACCAGSCAACLD